MANPSVKSFQIVYEQPATTPPAFKAFYIEIPPPNYPKLKGIQFVTTQPNLLLNYPKLKALQIVATPISTTVKQSTFKQLTLKGT